MRLKLAWMYMSLPTGFILMVLVSIELILKQVHELIDGSVCYGDVPDRIDAKAE